MKRHEDVFMTKDGRVAIAFHWWEVRELVDAAKAHKHAAIIDHPAAPKSPLYAPDLTGGEWRHYNPCGMPHVSHFFKEDRPICNTHIGFPEEWSSDNPKPRYMGYCARCSKITKSIGWGDFVKQQEERGENLDPNKFPQLYPIARAHRIVWKALRASDMLDQHVKDALAAVPPWKRRAARAWRRLEIEDQIAGEVLEDLQKE